MDRTRRIESAALWIASLLLIAGLLPTRACAVPRPFSIPAESAFEALAAYPTQAGLDVFYDANAIHNQRTNAVSGTYEPLVAMQMLLAHTGLAFKLTKFGIISIKVAKGHKEFVTGQQGRWRALTNFAESDPRQAPSRLSTADCPPAVVCIQAVGLRDPGPLPYGVMSLRFDAADLEDAGVTSVADWARSLPQNQGSGPTEDTYAFGREAQTNTALGMGLNLYGVGSRATLILVNGRRLAPSGSAGTFTDISNLPFTAIDHIEVISDGAAALYGADAIGGIVNFVLRGADSTPVSDAAISHLTLGSRGEKDFSQSLSKHWDHGGGVVAVEYYGREALPAGDRREATSNLTPWGGTDFFNPAGNPGTLIDSGGHVWGLPSGQNGTALTAAQLTPGPNQYDRVAGTWILPQQERLNVLASTTYEMTDHSSLFFDALVNRRRVESQDAALTSALTVPHTNAFHFNPVQGSQDPVTVLYGFGSDLGPITLDGQVNSGQFALGLNHQWGQQWNFRGYVGYTFEDQHDTEHNLVNFGVLQNYLDSSDPTTAFNPFGAGSNTNPKTLAAIRADGGADYESAFRTVDLTTTGAVPFLPAGPLTLTVGYDHRVQTFDTQLSAALSAAILAPAPATDRSRTVNAVFLQSSLPVIGSDPLSAWPVSLNLSAGIRYEHYSDAGQGVTPTVGFEFQPDPSLKLTGSWARLFRPPNLSDLNEASNISQIFPLYDSKIAGFVPALVVTGNNAQLRSETAHSWTLDLVVAPPSHPAFSATASYFNINSANRIVAVTPLPQTVLNDPRYDYLVQRTVGAQARADICSNSQFLGVQSQCLDSEVSALVDLRLHNVESLLADGFDVSGRYGLYTPVGAVSLNLNATYFLHYKEAETPSTPLVEYRNTDHNPPVLRLRSLVKWENRGFFASPAINFQSGYTDIDSIPHRPVRAWTTWDLVLGYSLRPFEAALGGETTVSLRGLNVFNQQPPFLNNAVSTIGYDPENGDLLGRRVSFTIQHRW